MARGDEFTCAYCGNTYLKGQEEEVAEGEFNANFGDCEDARAIICDDCYQLMAPPGGWPAEGIR